MVDVQSRTRHKGISRGSPRLQEQQRAVEHTGVQARLCHRAATATACTSHQNSSFSVASAPSLIYSTPRCYQGLMRQGLAGADGAGGVLGQASRLVSERFLFGPGASALGVIIVERGNEMVVRFS